MLEKKSLARLRKGYVGTGGKGPPSADSSRSGSPHTSAPSPASFIPQPKGAISRERIGLDKNRSRPSSTSSTSSIPHLPGKLPLGSNSSLGKGIQSAIYTTTGRSIPTASNNANSMLDKIKLFHGKDKIPSERTKVQPVTKNVTHYVNTSSNKRTSSSSGFSSARSEHSDSSTSIYSEPPKTSAEPKEHLTSPSFGKAAHITTTGSSIPAKSQVKKLGLPATKQLTSKTRTVDGKDPVSSKIDQLKSASRIAKEKRNEKLLKSASSENSNSPNENICLANNPRNPARTPSDTNSDIKQKKDDVSSQYTTIEPDNPVRESRVANLKDKVSCIPNSASHSTSVLSSNTDKLLTESSNTIVTSTSLPTMDGNSGVSQNGNSVLMSPPGSSIPKPTAAVKGTSKVIKDEKHAHQLNETSSPTNPKHNFQDKQLQGTKLSRDEIYVAVHIAGPDTQVLDVGNESRVSNLPKTERSRSDSRSGSSSNVSIAMVSPIMSSTHKKEKTPPAEIISEKGHTKQQQSKTISPKINSGIERDHMSSSNLRTNTEPIYKTCEKMHHSSDASAIAEESDDVVLNIKPMQPLLRASPYGYMRGLGPASSRTAVSTRIQSSLRVHADYAETGRFASSRQFLASLDNARMYGIAMKRALSGCNSLVDADYGHDMDSFDASGYMSDGEILRPVTFKSDDIGSGYLSEGGTPVYTRKNTARPPKESVPPIYGKESRIINVLQDDRNLGHPHRPLQRLGFDDSSSVSSEVSDTFPELSTDENLTGSSLSSDYNVYGSLKRSATHGRTSSHSGHKVNATCPDRNRLADEHPTASNTGGGSGKAKQAHVKKTDKTDSSMQTESSFSSAWKKYMLQKEEQMPNTYESPSGKNSPSEKPKDKKSQKNDSSKKSIAESHRPSKQYKGVGRPGVDPELSKSAKAGSCESLTSSGRKVSRSSVVQATQKEAAAASLKRQNTQAQYYGCNGVGPCTPNPKVTGSGVHRSGGMSKTSDKLTEQTARNDPDSIMTTSHCFSRPPPGTLVTANAPSSNVKSVTDEQKQRDRKGKVKVCANTQTNSSDLAGVHSDGEYSSLGRKYPPKEYFMTTPGPGTGLKERVYGTRSVLNGSPTPMSDYAMLLARTPRLSAPLRDLDNYASLDHGTMGAYSWMRHSPSCGTSVNRAAPTLTEADSMESLSSTSSSIHAQIQHARANSLTHARLMLHQRELSASPRLSRSNSIRSTKSEKLPSYLLQRSSDDPEGNNPATSHYQQPSNNGVSTIQNGSQPTSPSSAPQTTGRYIFPGAPAQMNSSNHANSRCSMSPYMTGLLSKMNSKEDEVHGSALSLVSTSSSIYSTAEEKQAHEIRKLKRELDQAHEKVTTLTSQLTTNAHMVAAFEQSLSNMTNRLQHLTATAEKKDSELMELRKTIEALKKQSAEAGLTKMALQSMQAVQRTLQEHRISRQFSTDSVSSVNSLSSACSGNSGQSNDPINSNKKKKKKGWLRSSFSKAFSRSKKNKNGSVSDFEDVRHLQSDSSTPNSPLLGNATHNGGGPLCSPQTALKQSHSSSALYDKDDSAPEVVKELKKQLREKDMILTDIRLDALSSAHQLESLKETVNKMRSEMASLKHDNDRLQRLVSTKSLTSSQSSLPHRTSLESVERSLSASEQTGSLNSDMYLNETRPDPDGKLAIVSVFLGCHGDISLYKNMQSSEVSIGNICITSKTQWDLLDNLVKRAFKEYVLRVDPISNLGLNAESVITYQVGDVMRSKEADIPELLPFGYIVGDNMNIKVILKGTKQHSVDALTFESLIPKSIVQRYISLLTEHRRIILCGPSGTGKTYVAQKLAEYLVLKNGKELTAGAIATFSVDHKSAKELRQYLSNVAEQCETSNASDLPTVIILDNLHHVGSLGEVFNGFLSAKYQKCPYIIGTMNQATCSTTNLQLHHNFRWVLCANHMEPVKGFLGRFLKRKLIEEEIKNGTQNSDITKVIDWMPKVWQHLNKYLETHSSSDVTIGPRLFLSCPVDLSGSQVWFTDLWNYSIIPYLLEAVREGLQLYGRRAPWEDPAEWVYETYPWLTHGPNSNDWPQLLRLRQEDVGYEGHPGPGMGSKTHHVNNTEAEADPLLNMLMRLQEAASYSSPHSNDSDSTSLDSHGSGLHSDELLNSGLESTL